MSSSLVVGCVLLLVNVTITIISSLVVGGVLMLVNVTITIVRGEVFDGAFLHKNVTFAIAGIFCFNITVTIKKFVLIQYIVLCVHKVFFIIR